MCTVYTSTSCEGYWETMARWSLSTAENVKGPCTLYIVA